MEYCNSYNGIAYQHSPQHSHEFRCGMMKVGYSNNTNNINGYDSGVYGHNQHINYGLHHQHHHHHHPPHQYANNRNIPSVCHYDSYKANSAQNYHQPMSYANNFESSYEPTTSATVTPPSAAFRSRFVGYQCEMQQCFPINGSQENHRGEYGPVNSSISRCLDPLASNHIGLPPDPRSHHHLQQQPYGHETIAHHAQHPMRMPLGYRAYDSLHQKLSIHHQRPIFESEPHQSWYGYSNEPSSHHYSNHHHHPHPNHHQNNHHHHHQQQQQQQHQQHYTEYTQHMQSPSGSPYATLNGHLATAKEDKALKMHRDRSLSKLVAMNRRLETQMSESERNDSLLYDHHFENFDYFSETPDSIASSSQFTNNDCIMNNATSETDNNNNIDGSLNNSHKIDGKEVNNHMTDSTDSEWLPTMDTTTTRTPSKEDTVTMSTNVTCADEENLNGDSKVSGENEHTKKNDHSLNSGVAKPSTKLNVNRKNAKSKKIAHENTMEKRRKRRQKKSNIHFDQIKDTKTDTIPLPGLQQALPGFQEAFGSTEIGRFSEIFFNASGSPIEIGLFESEADTLSPQPWETEMGDSLEGPHFSMQPNNTPLSYTESLGSTDSPTASNNSFFSELRASEF